ncbi:MAG: type II toxin-antitoxin system VapC family toxin [Mesorhizobium sp.]|nr:MAG: type II toxin-antitoxin system VapC family toxin [Mesorhizobium sp.]
MILLDTNVVSEVMRAEPHPAVLAWLDDQAAETLYLSSVTLAEMLFGIEAMPAGRRKNALAEAFAAICAVFDQRILAFDAEAARRYADLAVKARTAGKGFPVPDGYIAAIAAARGFRVASRDTAPFHAAGVQIINPCDDAS